LKLYISLQLNRRRLAGRGLERLVGAARRPTRGTPEECADAVLDRIRQVHLQLNDTSKSSNEAFKKNMLPLPGSARCYALGQRGPLQAVAAPLTPLPRGTSYEVLPFILERV
jgi:hypothetical protein